MLDRSKMYKIFEALKDKDRENGFYNNVNYENIFINVSGEILVYAFNLTTVVGRITDNKNFVILGQVFDF